MLPEDEMSLETGFTVIVCIGCCWGCSLDWCDCCWCRCCVVFEAGCVANITQMFYYWEQKKYRMVSEYSKTRSFIHLNWIQCKRLWFLSTHSNLNVHFSCVNVPDALQVYITFITKWFEFTIQWNGSNWISSKWKRISSN